MNEELDSAGHVALMGAHKCHVTLMGAHKCHVAQRETWGRAFLTFCGT